MNIALCKVDNYGEFSVLDSGTTYDYSIFNDGGREVIYLSNGKTFINGEVIEIYGCGDKVVAMFSDTEKIRELVRKCEKKLQFK